MVCLLSGTSLTVTANRHRIATIYASSHMSLADRECFFAHMGHSETVSKENFQCPAAVREIAVMGNMLGNLDSGNYKVS